VNAFAQGFAVVAALVHLWIFLMESVRFRRVHAMFEVRAADVEAVRPWAFHQGCYNAFLGLQALAGVAAAHLGSPSGGRALVLAAGASMLGASVALVAFDPRRSRLTGLLGQGTPALATLVAVLA
jgi:putative membrane protein